MNRRRDKRAFGTAVVRVGFAVVALTLPACRAGVAPDRAGDASIGRRAALSPAANSVTFYQSYDHGSTVDLDGGGPLAAREGDPFISATGLFGLAVDGATTPWLSYVDSTGGSIDLSKPGSVSFWVKADAGYVPSCFFMSFNAYSRTNLFVCDHGDALGIAAEVYFNQGTSSEQMLQEPGSGVSARSWGGDGLWHLVVVNWAPAAVAFSIDGGPLSVKPVSWLQEPHVYGPGIGNLIYAGGGHSGYAKDELIVLNRPMTGDEIQWYYAQRSVPMLTNPAPDHFNTDGDSCSTPDDMNPCTVDACDVTGVTHTPLDDGTACGQGGSCGRPATCHAGTCVPTGPTPCAGQTHVTFYQSFDQGTTADIAATAGTPTTGEPLAQTTGLFGMAEDPASNAWQVYETSANASPSDIDLWSPGSVSMWVKPDDQFAYGEYFMATDLAANLTLYVSASPTSVTAQMVGVVGSWVGWTPDNRWHLIVVNWSRTGIGLSVDGAPLVVQSTTDLQNILPGPGVGSDIYPNLITAGSSKDELIVMNRPMSIDEIQWYYAQRGTSLTANPAVDHFNNDGSTCNPYDDLNPCTADACDPSGGVTHTPADGTACSDGNSCTTGDVCQAGTCQAGASSCSAAIDWKMLPHYPGTDTYRPTRCPHFSPPAVDGNPCTTDAGTPGCFMVGPSIGTGGTCEPIPCNAANGGREEQCFTSCQTPGFTRCDAQTGQWSVCRAYETCDGIDNDCDMQHVADNDGVCQLPYSMFDPNHNHGWDTILDGCGSQASGGQIAQYVWDVQLPAGTSHVASTSCTTNFVFPTESPVDSPGFPVTLTVVSPDGGQVSTTRSVPIRNTVIASMGDSIASGEGNPDIPAFVAPHGASAHAHWADERCHRSQLSHHALVAKQLEDGDPHTSVTFVSFACSGAGIYSGLLKPYIGEEHLPNDQVCLGIIGGSDTDGCLGTIGPVDTDEYLTPQIQALETVMSPYPRKIDALLLQVGANDARFGNIIRLCAHGDGVETIDQFTACTKAQSISTQINSILTEQLGPPPDSVYGDPLNLALFSTLNDSLHKTDSSGDRLLNFDDYRVYISEYPNPAHNDDGTICPEFRLKDAADRMADAKLLGARVLNNSYTADLVAIFAGAGSDSSDAVISIDDIKWADAKFLVDLNNAIGLAAATNKWTFVTGVNAELANHGYCAQDHDFVRYEESWDNQFNDNGSFHPNNQGQFLYTVPLCPVIANDLGLSTAGCPAVP